ncbi:MAG: DUF3084 domain-containing protein [Bacillota bacterium]|nr:DUF3084 domain-containing protein [Bacillota bacterium]
MYGFTLILILAVVGGVIAYIGDRLGMNVGRKKLTLFGLRPKYTSILVTIVTGVFIASASIGILTIASQDVRTALFKMKEIQDELFALQTNYYAMKSQRDSAQMELLEAESRISEAVTNYEHVIAALVEAEKQVELQRQSIQSNEETIEKMDEEVIKLQQQAIFLEREVSELLAKTDQLRSDYELVSTAFGQIRGANIAFNASEVILTTVLKKGLSREEIRKALERFIHEVDEVAYRRSARVSEPQPYRAIFLQSGVLEFAVEDILMNDGDVIVRAVSESNTIPGVPVRVYLENYPDQMVFSKGTVLSTSLWDPKSDLEIERVILQILSDAKGVALEAGMALSQGAAVLLPGEDFLNSITASHGFETQVEIRLVVAKDTWRSNSPVQVYLEIIP